MLNTPNDKPEQSNESLISFLQGGLEHSLYFFRFHCLDLRLSGFDQFEHGFIGVERNEMILDPSGMCDGT